jgi:phosphatidate phosphatase APP1
MKLSSLMINGALSICTAIAFSACGSSDSVSAGGSKTGYFYDEPVGGLTYTCTGSGQTVSGTTSSDGSFRYNTGDTCSFSAGNISLGSVAVPSDAKVMPQDIAGVSRTDTTNSVVTKIAQFLQSISDTTSGNIVISAADYSKIATSCFYNYSKC